MRAVKDSLATPQERWIGLNKQTDGFLCSRNARSQKTLVGRAQCKINQPRPLKKNGAEKVPGTIDYLVTIPRPDRFHDADWEKEIHRLRQGTSDGEK